MSMRATIAIETMVLVSRYLLILSDSRICNKREMCAIDAERMTRITKVLKMLSISMNSQMAPVVTEKPATEMSMPMTENIFSSFLLKIEAQHRPVRLYPPI